MLVVVGQSRLSEDTALGVVLSVFFGVGILLLTYISKQNNATRPASTNSSSGRRPPWSPSNVRDLAILGGIALLVVAVLYKEFKLLTFDPGFAASVGFNTNLLTVLLTSLIVVAVVIGLQTVGVVLMAAMLSARPRRRGSGPTAWSHARSVGLVRGALRRPRGSPELDPDRAADRPDDHPEHDPIVAISLALRAGAGSGLASTSGNGGTAASSLSGRPVGSERKGAGHELRDRRFC